LAKTSKGYADNIEAVLDSVDGTSSFSVKDSGNVEVVHIDSDGNIEADGSLSIDGTGDSYIMGKVGIGMTSPDAKFTISDGTVLVSGSTGETFTSGA